VHITKEITTGLIGIQGQLHREVDPRNLEIKEQVARPGRPAAGSILLQITALIRLTSGP
jgi:hypothetical protein